MMRFQVIERHRRWRSVDNHLDARHCPICHATVHGPRGQAEHLQWHVRLSELLDGHAEHAEIPQQTPWTAAVDDGQGSSEGEQDAG